MIVVEQIDSQHLAGNVIGDPSQRDLVVYLPLSYHTSTRHYPTLYLLHGFFGHSRDWVAGTNMGEWWLQPLDEILDPAIAKHHAAEMIVAAPDGWSRYGCSQWVDSSVNGNFEQYVTQEVVPYVDSHFRTIPRPGSRGILGDSSGGLGAWHLGSGHPDIFGAMAVLSADSYFDVTHKPWFYKFYNSVYPHEPNGPVEGNSWSALCYGLASCYTPNVAKPPYYVDFPIEFPSGEVIQPLWEQWLRYDPVVNWQERIDSLCKMRGILLDVGYKDQHNLHYGHRLLSRRLDSAGIRHDVEEHDGTHCGSYYKRLQRALSWFSQVLDLQP